ncbi:MAG: PfkB family carbohydrate kinase [Ardenticatenaceae bacterium]|nr:PfkB family carbohydrate kinase [Ardenticatenaceae bacterium]
MSVSSYETTTAIDYLVIGHVTRDKVPEGYNPGGTVTFSGRLAQALGCRTAVVTSARPDYDLSEIMAGMAVHVVPAEEDSIFANIYQGNNRVQILSGRADDITAADIPPQWRRPAIVHLGPLTNEIDPDVIDLFPNSLIGVTPQGWMRRWDDTGRVFATPFPAEEEILGKADAVVISEEDLLDEAMFDRYVAWSKLLVMTQNYAGCTVFFDGRQHAIPAPQIELVEPTGAGDIFAAAFFVELWRNDGDPIKAAEFANHVAAHSVTMVDLDKKVSAWKQTGPKYFSTLPKDK